MRPRFEILNLALSKVGYVDFDPRLILKCALYFIVYYIIFMTFVLDVIIAVNNKSMI